MKSLLFALSLLFVRLHAYSQTQSSPYAFGGGYMSLSTLNNYLDKSITVQGIADPEAIPQELDQVNAMVKNTGAMFVGRIGGWYGGDVTDKAAYFKAFSDVTAKIHADNPQVICQAGIYETMNGNLNTFQIPLSVFKDVDQAFGRPAANHASTLDYTQMRYDQIDAMHQYKINGSIMSSNDRETIPDITKAETQYWFYYLATKYIDAGCEAIHFGQLPFINRADIGNTCLWKLLTVIRGYAHNHNRGVVLCDAHTPDGGAYYEPTLSISVNDWQDYVKKTYFDMSSVQGQLIFDFHSMPLDYDEELPVNCSQTGASDVLRVTLNQGKPLQQEKFLIQRSFGGKRPLYPYENCLSNPYLLEFDNYGADQGTLVGCAAQSSLRWWRVWNWDVITWFAMQPSNYRQEVLGYSYYRLKCLDPVGHVEMPGRRNLTILPYGSTQNYTPAENYYTVKFGNLYQCYNGPGATDQATIKNIWNRTISLFNYPCDNSTCVIRNHKTGQVLEIGGGSPVTERVGSPANQWPASNDGRNQWWIRTAIGNGIYGLTNVNSNYRLQIGNSLATATSSGSIATQQAETIANDQYWAFQQVGVTGRYSIRNIQSGGVLQLAGGNPSPGAAIDQAEYAGSDHQQWQLFPIGGKYADFPYVYTISNVKSNNNLDIYNPEAQGSYAILKSSSGLDSQHWTLTAVAGQPNVFSIKNAYSGYVLEIGGGNPTIQGARADQWLDNSATTPQQQWLVLDAGTGDGSFKITNQARDNNGQAQNIMALEVFGAGIADGSNIDQWDYTGGTHQRWYINRFASYRPLATASQLPAQERILRLYPNPTAEILHIAFDDETSIDAVTITDLRGKNVQEVYQASQINTASLASGVYLLIVKAGKHEYHKKFVKE